MKKKLEKYLMNIATDIVWDKGLYCYKDYEDNYYIMNKTHIIRLREPVPGIEVNAHAKEIIDIIRRNIFIYEVESIDYKMLELPSVELIKKGIRDMVGRALDRVVYVTNEEEFAINARYLYKMMDALNSKVCYYKDERDPIFFFEKDDLQSDVYGLILPVHKDVCYKKGFNAV